MASTTGVRGHTSLRTNVITTYAARFSNIIGLFLLFPLVAHAVSAPAYGLYLLVASVASLVQMDLGMASSTIRFIASSYHKKATDEARRVIASSMWFFLVLAIVCATVFGLIFVLGWRNFDIPESLTNDAVILVCLGCVQIFVGLSTSVHRQVLTGVGSLTSANLVQILQLLIRILLTIAVLAVGGGIVSVGIVDTTAVVLGGAATWIFRRIRFGDTNTRLSNGSWETFKGMFRLNIDLLVLGVAALVILQSSNLILSLTLPIAAVAVFGAGYRCYQVCREVTNSLTSALLPVATSHHVSGQMNKSQDLYLSGTKFANALLLVVVVPVIVFAHQFLQAWVGSELAAGFVVAQVLLISLIANNNHLIAVPVLTGQGHITGYAILHSIWAVSTVVVGFALAPLIGVVGIALAVAVPVIILEPIYISIALRRLNLTWRDFMIDVGLPTLVPGIGLGVIFLAVVSRLNLRSTDFWSAVAGTVIWVVIFSSYFFVVGAGKADRSRIISMLLNRKDGVPES